MIRRALLVTLALTGCGSDGGESARRQHQLIAAARKGLYAVKAAPGGALALFSDVSLVRGDTVCGTVDAQDGGGPRRFSSVAGAEPTVEQPGDPRTRATIEQTCRGPARKVSSRNVGYTDLQVDEQPR